MVGEKFQVMVYFGITDLKTGLNLIVGDLKRVSFVCWMYTRSIPMPFLSGLLKVVCSKPLMRLQHPTIQHFHTNMQVFAKNHLTNTYQRFIIAHRCTYPGCGKVLVLDGNLKNRRDVCASTEAGYIEYNSLPGAIKTGCQLSPYSTSKFCFYHAPRFSKNAEGKKVSEIQIITAVRETRSGKCYKVKVKVQKWNLRKQSFQLLL